MSSHLMFTNYIINANKTRMTMTTTIKSEDLISDGITNKSEANGS